MIKRTLAAALLLSVASGPAAGQGNTSQSNMSQDSMTLPGVEQAPQSLFTGSRAKDILVAQVLLDRSHHSPGAIDGIAGSNTSRAVRAFQRANGMSVDGNVSNELIQKLVELNSGEVLQSYTITSEDVSGPFVDVPAGMEQQAQLEQLAYADAAEKLAEKFHMTQGFLQALNPNTDFGSAGSTITVVAAGADNLDTEVTRIEIDKASSSLRAYNASGQVVATYPATVGSSSFPSPTGTMEVRAIAPDPTYHFDPSGREWGPDEQLTIAAGPNNPVGSAWIDLSKDGYGIHGTPEPRNIGKTASHGCVRLTNWDAEELLQAVKPGTTVEFV